MNKDHSYTFALLLYASSLKKFGMLVLRIHEMLSIIHIKQMPSEHKTHVEEYYYFINIKISLCEKK